MAEGNDKCALTGISFDYNEKTDDDEWLCRPLSPSLDRIDNLRGYELDNVRVVCACVNVAVNEWGLENFEMICRAFVQLKGNQPRNEKAR